MKTPEQWKEWCEFEANCSPTLGVIAAIQYEAREGMVSKEELRPTIELLKAQVEDLKYINWSEHQVPCQPIIDELTRLETLLGEKK